MHLAGADQPNHPGGHHRGLSGAGAGDDHPGGKRCRYRSELLVAERHPQQVDQLSGGT